MRYLCFFKKIVYDNCRQILACSLANFLIFAGIARKSSVRASHVVVVVVVVVMRCLEESYHGVAVFRNGKENPRNTYRGFLHDIKLRLREE